MPLLLQLRPESTPIVNLPIESQNEAAIRRHHRLVTELSEINYRQPPKRQSSPKVRLDPYSGIIWTPVPEPVSHLLHESLSTRPKITGGVEPGKATHYKRSRNANYFS